MFSLQDTSKKGMSKLSAIFCPLSASTALFVVTSHLFAATTFTTSGEAFCKEKKKEQRIFVQSKFTLSFLYFYRIYLKSKFIKNEILSRILTS